MLLCLKCGSKKHPMHTTCGCPVTSFGLIVLSNDKISGKMYDPTREFHCSGWHPSKPIYSVYKSQSKLRNPDMTVLLVERKDTIAFINLIQGNYPVNKKDVIVEQCVADLTCEERFKILNFTWDELWAIVGSKRKNKIACFFKFKKLKINEFFQRIPCMYTEADYTMPKGRLKPGETTIQCAVREFSEETGYDEQEIDVTYNYPFFVEDFVGTDDKRYRNVFYIASINEKAKIKFTPSDNYLQRKEVRNVGWFSLLECMDLLRDNKKKRILIDCFDFLDRIVSKSNENR